MQTKTFETLIIFIILVFGFIAAQCSKNCTVNEDDDELDAGEMCGGDADTDIDIDTDADSDSDTDVDSGADTDTDTDTDTGSDPNKCDGSGLTPGLYGRIIVFDGRIRTYQLYVPMGYDSTVATPVVFDLHPFTTNAVIVDRMTGFSDKADEEGFILVQPNGVARSWNGGPLCCGRA
ncbi:MAG: hypothetical protein GY847_15265 [Proteobacteria bacterium]|nr:hypothetical protein [Pseudomonadota bacterium]